MDEYIIEINNLEVVNFQSIRMIANNSLAHLSERERENLRNELERGKKVIQTKEELAQYLFSYGNMHEEKIHKAVEKIDPNILNNEFEIIDWGCGQGLATITFFDFLNKNQYTGKAKNVTLIEPSQIALERAFRHVKIYTYRVSNIKPKCKFIDEIEENDIKSNGDLPVIHFFSNILDIPNINLLVLSNKIKNTLISDNIIVSVGPVYANNERLDLFYRKYFYSAKPLIFEIDKSDYEYGNNQKCTFKAKVFKLEATKQGNLIPLEFYPSVQFHAAYKLDCVSIESIGKQNAQILKSLTVSDTSSPFDIGASIYDDIHPILAVLNNIITRGLPTKASPFLENVFQQTFNYSQRFEKYGTFSYPAKKNIDIEKTLTWFEAIVTKKKPINYEEIDTDCLQLIFSPLAIARIQKIILEALMTEKLDIKSKEWRILVEEKDVPCSALAFADLSEMFNNLTKLSQDYQDLVFPEIKLEIISNKTFINSKLHLNKENNVTESNAYHFKNEYDLVIDIAMFDTSNIKKESFSKFKCKNKCYFNIRSVLNIKSERNIYTTDRIIYRNVVEQNQQGQYIEIEETKNILKYFLQLLFRKEDFRPGQLPILNRALQNKAVIGLLPTGGGKSLTYQLAAMLQPGVTLIVDPLRSLMQDQYDGLINIGIDSCAYINSTMTANEKKKVEKKMEQSQLLFVFLSPERLAIYKFREKLKNMHELHVYFSYGVIDEVHCVSEWGHDFRIPYLHLGRNLYNYVRAKEGSISLFGLTATASFDVLADVERELSGNGAFPLDAETIVRYENSNRLEIQYKIEKINVDFQDEMEALKKSIFATPAKIAAIENRYKSLIDNKLSIPVKISDKSAFYDAKRNFMKEYIKVIPKYIREIQTENSIQNIKDAFEVRQGNNVGIDIELETNITDNYFSKNIKYNQAGIIFCPHKSNTSLAVNENKASLINLVPDIGSYSGGDDDDVIANGDNSIENLELFRTNKQPIMVATKAFGMGIDKPNVRFTINMNYSSSLESFVQEAGRAGRDRKMALSVILMSDYELARINKKYPENGIPFAIIGKWFKTNDLQQIISHYNLNIDNQYIDYLTPANDLVRIFCKEGTAINGKYYSFNNCADAQCRLHNNCPFKGVPIEAEGWIYSDDLFTILNNNNIKIDKKYIEYQNADYETVMYFYNNSFKGEVIEKKTMIKILSFTEAEVFYGDDAEIKGTTTYNGFLTPFLKAKEMDEMVILIKYNNSNKTNIAKAIYRMTCIGLIDDFTEDYSNHRYRVVAKKKADGSYYKSLKTFLLRYYSEDRAEEEIRKVPNYKGENEIHKCLGYLTEFVYEKIAIKRKRAIDDMRTFCMIGVDDSKDWKEINEELKDFIFYYFNSKYARSDYRINDGENFSLTKDTNEGKESSYQILQKYLKIIDEDFLQNKSEPGSTPIDNVKHLQGAVRLLRRSLTDSNPALSLLITFCILFLGTNNNENLERELVESYKDGMLEFAKRADRDNKLPEFWDFHNEYNEKIRTFSNNKLNEIKDEIAFKVNHDKFKQIILNYIG